MVAFLINNYYLRIRRTRKNYPMTGDLSDSQRKTLISQGDVAVGFKDGTVRVKQGIFY